MEDPFSARSGPGGDACAGSAGLRPPWGLTCSTHTPEVADEAAAAAVADAVAQPTAQVYLWAAALPVEKQNSPPC